MFYQYHNYTHKQASGDPRESQRRVVQLNTNKSEHFKIVATIPNLSMCIGIADLVPSDSNIVMPDFSCA